MWVRWAGTGDSMRAMGEKIGSPAATVSQIEKGQRALKEPKIASWAAALGVDQDDLYELWVLCQGLVPADRGRPVFYSERPDVLSSVALDDDEILKTLSKHPELEPIYRLAARICAVMNRLLPSEEFGVQPRKFEDPIPTDLDDGEYNGGASGAFVPLPGIWVVWHDPDTPDPAGAVTVPLLKQPTPIVRRRATSVLTADLEDLIRTLSGAERERVRGYIEAVVEERSRRDGEIQAENV